MTTKLLRILFILLKILFAAIKTNVIVATTACQNIIVKVKTYRALKWAFYSQRMLLNYLFLLNNSLNLYWCLSLGFCFFLLRATE